MNRRQFLKTNGALAVGVTLGPLLLKAAPTSHALVDVNVTLGRWPFRRLPLDETKALVAKLRDNGVTQGWAASFDALLHRDLATVNARLAEECRRNGRGLLVPFGSVNPALPDWETDLRRCHEQHRMLGLRLYPNYHGYKLDDPQFAKLLALAHSRQMVVQIALSMEDERMQNFTGQVPHADATPLLTALKDLPTRRLVVLNWFRAVKPELIGPLAQAGVCFDISTLEGVGGIANLLKDVPTNQVAFGSHAPFFYFESAALKLKESALGASEHLIRSGNARRLLAR